MRVKGELLLQDSGDQAAVTADQYFGRAIEVARRQGALMWELRNAVSLAGLRVRQGRDDEARQILAPVYDRFTEGFEMTDLRSARTMLESPPSHRVASECQDICYPSIVLKVKEPPPRSHLCFTTINSNLFVNPMRLD